MIKAIQKRLSTKGRVFINFLWEACLLKGGVLEERVSPNTFRGLFKPENAVTAYIMTIYKILRFQSRNSKSGKTLNTFLLI